jgi:hypothetical protein
LVRGYLEAKRDAIRAEGGDADRLLAGVRETPSGGDILAPLGPTSSSRAVGSPRVGLAILVSLFGTKNLMMRSCLALVFAGLLLAPSPASGTGSEPDAEEVTVCPWVACDHATIANAIAALPSGGNILVAYDLHTEAGIIVDRDVTISGQGMWYTTVQGATTHGGASQGVFHIVPGVTVTIRDMIIRHGNAVGYYGGGIFNHGNLTVRNCFIISNDADSGGGGIANRNPGVLQVVETVIGGNSATDGGGVFDDSAGVAALVSCTVSGNEATGDGGGLLAAGASLNLYNSTISGNRADGGGGGLAVRASATAAMASCTVTDNTANYDGATVGGDTGGGVLVTTGNLSLVNTIVAGNVAIGSPIGNECAGQTITSTGHNLYGEEPNVCPNGTGDQNLVSGTDVIAQVMGLLAYRGGSTPVHPLRTASPAIDAANETYCMIPGIDGEDQRGEARGWDADGTPDSPAVGDCDIGAFEMVATDPLFFDRFESGNTLAWSAAFGGP